MTDKYSNLRDKTLLDFTTDEDLLPPYYFPPTEDNIEMIKAVYKDNREKHAWDFYMFMANLEEKGQKDDALKAAFERDLFEYLNLEL